MLIARLGLSLFDSFASLDATGAAYVEAVSQLVLRRGNDTRENAVVSKAKRVHQGRTAKRVR